MVVFAEGCAKGFGAVDRRAGAEGSGGAIGEGLDRARAGRGGILYDRRARSAVERGLWIRERRVLEDGGPADGPGPSYTASGPAGDPAGSSGNCSARSGNPTAPSNDPTAPANLTPTPDRIARELTELLGADPVFTIDTETLGEAIVTLSAHIHVANHRLLVLLAEFDRRGGWKPAGHRSCAHWLAFRTGIGLGAAREWMRAARALHKLPQTSAAMARGELSFSKVRALTRVADDLDTPEEEARLVEFARECTAAQLETLIRGWKTVSRKDEVELERERHRSRFLSVCPAEDGMYRVRGRLDPEVGALLMRAIEAAGDAIFRSSRDWAPEGGTRGPATREITPRQRRADAIGLLVEQAMRVGFGATGSAHAEDVSAETCGGGADEAGPAEAEDASAENCEGADATGSTDTKDVSAETSEGEDEARPPNAKDGSAGTDQGVARAGSAEAEDVSAETSPGAERCDNRSGSTRRRTGTQGAGTRGAGGGASCSAPISGTRAERYQVVLHMDVSTLRAEGERDRSHLSDGTRVSAETSRRLCCDAGVVRATRGPQGEVLDMGRRTRSIPPALRRALEIRDGGCRFPGCGIRFTEGHHIVHWADGGETNLSNLVLLCRFHHRAVHEEGFGVKLLPGRCERSGRVDRIRFFDRAGWPLPDAAPPTSAVRRACAGGPERVGTGQSECEGAGQSEFEGASQDEVGGQGHRQGEPDPLRALIRTHSRRGLRPNGFTTSARWRTSREIPWELEARAWEALDS